MEINDRFNRCCYCEKQIMSDEIFHFRRCYNTHGRWAHRICPKCWWDIVVPLSEDIHFKCFGCEKKWPLWFFPKPSKKHKKISQQQIIKIDD